MDDQVEALDSAAKLLNVEKDRLHPLVHCKYILQLDTISSLQALLQAISDNTPKGQERTTYEHNTAIWLESRILAVQLWVVKRLLIQIQLFETENRALHIQIQDSLSGILIRMQDLSKEVAALRDNFHRVRPGRTKESLQEEWAKNFFVDGAKNVNSGDVGLESTIQPPQLAAPHKVGSGEPTPHSILLENLSIVAAYSRQESVIWKIERFLSRVENVYYRVSRAITYLDRLAQDLQLRFLRYGVEDTEKEDTEEPSRIAMGDGTGAVARFKAPRSQALTPQQKNLIRSIRGRIKIAHSLLRDSREEFSSYGPQGKFEIEGTPGISSSALRSNNTLGLAVLSRNCSDSLQSTQRQVPHRGDETQDPLDENHTHDMGPTGVEFGKSLPLSLEHESIESIEEDEELPVERSDASDVMQIPRYISRGKLMAAHRARMIPELREEDLEEMFVRGSGPGGQAINKTSSSVSLIHRPTGIRVQCQATRSREQNRKIARKIMVDKLDQLANPGLSKVEVQQEKVRAKKRQRAKKAKKKAKLKADAGRTERDGN
ncbi:RF-1 domain, partial [Rhizoctonia solani]